MARRLFDGLVLCLGIAQAGCQHSETEATLPEQLTGNWSGKVYQVYEARSNASAEVNLEQYLTPVTFQVPAESVQFRIGEAGIQVFLEASDPVSFDLVMFNAKDRTLSCMVSSGEKAVADYTILSLTADSLLLR